VTGRRRRRNRRSPLVTMIAEQVGRAFEGWWECDGRVADAVQQHQVHVRGGQEGGVRQAPGGHGQDGHPGDGSSRVARRGSAGPRPPAPASASTVRGSAGTAALSPPFPIGDVGARSRSPRRHSHVSALAEHPPPPRVPRVRQGRSKVGDPPQTARPKREEKGKVAEAHLWQVGFGPGRLGEGWWWQLPVAAAAQLAALGHDGRALTRWAERARPSAKSSA
jgi:hypothetical protein